MTSVRLSLVNGEVLTFENCDVNSILRCLVKARKDDEFAKVGDWDNVTWVNPNHVVRVWAIPEYGVQKDKDSDKHE